MVQERTTAVHLKDIGKKNHNYKFIYLFYLFGFREFTHAARHNRDVKP